MAKNSVLGHPDNVPKLAREGFNLDKPFTFTSSCGQLLPVWQDILNPGETIKGSPSFLIRTDHFLAPAMADIDVFVDLFFVPLQKILSAFGEWFYQIDDIRTDYITPDNFSEYLPICKSQINEVNPFSNVGKEIFDKLMTDDLRSRYFVQKFDSFGFGLHRLLFHFGMNPQSIFFSLYDDYRNQDEQTATGIISKFRDIQLDYSCPNFCPYWFAAYQGIYFDYYRNSEFESNNVKAYNLDSVFNDGSQVIDMDSVLAEGSPYGRRGMFELRYRWRGRDYFTATRSNPLINGISMLPSYSSRLNQVNQWLTQGSFSYFDRGGNQPGYDPDPDYAATVVGSSFGVNGGVSLTGAPAGELDNPVVGDATFDLVPSIVTNGVGGSLSVTKPVNLSQFGVGVSNLYIEESSIANARLRLENPHSHTLQAGLDLNKGTLAANASSLNGVINTAQLRTMFALEKLARVTQRAGKHYDDQTLAHFGFKVNKGLSGEVYKIKSWHSMIGIQKVTSTADTQGAALGEQAAVGAGYLDGRKQRFEFTAPCHGIVMCIFSIAPRYKYIGTVDKLSFKTKLWDFYKPSLDNLGSQPLFAFETAVKSNNDGSPSTAVVGWQWRFMESKVKFGTVAPVFATNSLNPWSMVATPETYIYEGKVSPMDLNLLINTQYDPAPDWPEEGQDQDHKTYVGNFATKYLRDPFKVDFLFNCTKVSTMSTFGDTPLNGI